MYVYVTGLYALDLIASSPGEFSVALDVRRPPLDRGGRNDVQTISIDFDGSTVDLAESIFLGAPPGIIVTLSPLSGFLPRWGLQASDEDDVTDAILRVVQESLVDDIERLGDNRRRSSTRWSRRSAASSPCTARSFSFETWRG